MTLNEKKISPPAPRGFRCYATHAGVKEQALDLALVVADAPCAAAAVFTQNSFVAPSITLGRERLRSGQLQALIVVSGNANVANGAEGERAVHEICELVAEKTGVEKGFVLPSFTGVIGRPLPLQKVKAAIDRIDRNSLTQDFEDLARAIMTTDRNPKLRAVQIEGASLLGVIKGAGMIEPNMATLLAYFFTDADIETSALDAMFRRAIDRSLNMISVDSDTSTSDTAAIFASGLAGPVDPDAFEQALTLLAIDLGRDLLLDAEGAGKLIEVCVKGARGAEQARRLAKSVVNSPLVKTAVHGADPNWGRVLMALGKTQDADVIEDKISVRFNDVLVYDGAPLGEGVLGQLRQTLSERSVRIEVDLRAGAFEATAWGCDLTEEYIRINAYYTT